MYIYLFTPCATMSCQLEELKQLHDAKPTDDDRWRVYGLKNGE